ncbi:putative DNA modification/repair radical SAM protein [Dyadobacter sp. BE34]|uniref:DNA modification/repair radical SAM protein n=1 Tax=Dyadobacter fermentans TaxID=94254 RepID=A0ABU1QWV6_9BACT|nr:MULTISPECIES: putative DNA modification/repair radical SAM protein [Dyadobacter]MDR6805648.1 putative DNA modification/repair radical SAM protein [Dyadobacter fermentans]MDR7042592.1 putative DNA modification/repair radical SAM protein [Dyadobacter sp. BE242]MDR7196904.1 putative DNA modification/repair radical SAM protein [Dyadobacter sp. BE34]MDR7215661.1 putative DNA modification/repair radical SAM protein [Dyadobacter sp. BE31]MDR7263197.1 putative DNA modification/repair radical SAM pr
MYERIREKLGILADAAKYDVSCSSSGSNRKNENKGIGDSEGTGICHTYTEDGRCVSLLKILLTNHCIYDCAFCVSRRSNDIKRAAFTVEEVVELTMNFYRRNYIEGLFLSSGIFKDADYTMERLVRIVKKLRQEERFNGYIHLKTIPGASDELLREAGMYADRMSINLEMPTETGLKLLAPEKSHAEVKKPLKYIQNNITQFESEKALIKSVPKFVPAGQSTQIVVGATPESDKEILYTANAFYQNFSLKRVYYSGYIPISNDVRLPVIGSQPPLIRENRLYQADWLMRFYGFKVQEILNDIHPNLEADVDPKLSWALRNLDQFPIDINTADYFMILRVPGIGVSSALKIVQARKFNRLYESHLRKLGIAFRKARHFIRYADSPVQLKEYEAGHIKGLILSESKSKYQKNPLNQLSLF